MHKPADIPAFIRHWRDAWNRRDLDAVLELFDDDIIFTSPLAQKVVPASGGVVRGKAALRDYWGSALAQIPELEFQITAALEGVDTVLIGFRNQGGPPRFDVLRFRDGLVIEGHGTDPVSVPSR